MSNRVIVHSDVVEQTNLCVCPLTRIPPVHVIGPKSNSHTTERPDHSSSATIPVSSVPSFRPRTPNFKTTLIILPAVSQAPSSRFSQVARSVSA